MNWRNGFQRRLCALLLVALASCDRAPVYVPDSDQRMKFLVEYHPTLKTIHDQLIFEALNCWKNIGSLKTMSASFKEKETVDIVEAKIQELKEQRASLEAHVRRIQAEAEKGIAYRMFEKIEGGGTRPPALLELESDCVRALARAQESAAMILNEPVPGSGDFSPPKAIPVWPPKALPVATNKRAAANE